MVDFDLANVSVNFYRNRQNLNGTSSHSSVSLLQQLILPAALFTHFILGVEACSNIRVTLRWSEMTKLQSAIATEQTSSCPLEVEEVTNAMERALPSKISMNSNASANLIMSDSSISNPSSISSSAITLPYATAARRRVTLACRPKSPRAFP